MTDVLFTAADLAEMRAFNEANLPHTAGLRSGTRDFSPTGSGITWSPGDPTWVEPCRVSPAIPPQERLSAGSITNINEFWVVLAQDVSVPVNTSTTHYRLEVTHTIPGLASPLMLYVKGTPYRSYEMLRKVLCTTEAPK
jgi:hypothetical protein